VSVIALLTVSEAATALRISKTGIYRLFSRGELRWVQVGAHRRVSTDEIARFCATQERAS